MTVVCLPEKSQTTTTTTEAVLNHCTTTETNLRTYLVHIRNSALEYKWLRRITSWSFCGFLLLQLVAGVVWEWLATILIQ